MSYDELEYALHHLEPHDTPDGISVRVALTDDGETTAQPEAS
jgi:hypothetical protein